MFYGSPYLLSAKSGPSALVNSALELMEYRNPTSLQVSLVPSHGRAGEDL